MSAMIGCGSLNHYTHCCDGWAEDGTKISTQDVALPLPPIVLEVSCQLLTKEAADLLYQSPSYP